jgi:hypothetical protein
VRHQQKISVTVSPTLVADLDYIGSRIGASRSALISELMSPAAADMRRLLESFPPEPTPADVLRLRGESAQVIREHLGKLQEVASGHDLFPNI